MNRLIVAALLSVGVFAGVPSHADETAGCATGTAVSVKQLPAPLSKWGQIQCTAIGQVITSSSNWVWVEPSDRAQIVIPAQFEGIQPGSAGYFSKVEISKIAGAEFEKAYATFHDGLDPNEGMPQAYRVDLTAASGTTLTMYFFDYYTYGWGMVCPKGECDAQSRFMMLDTEHPPEKLAPAI